jgi:uncharacterized membrane protein YuzA (DUF378 family)
MMAKSTLDWITLILVLIGGLNWGLIGIGGWNIVDMIFGSIPILARIIYILVGISALYMLYANFKK